MDEKSLRLLELDKVLLRLEGHAAFSASKDMARTLRPTAVVEEARRRQQTTAEARQLLLARPDLTIGGAHDVRPAVDRAARGAVLDPTDLVDIRSTLIAARTLTRLFPRIGEAAPGLAAIVGRIDLPPGLIEAISRVLSERGDVLDGASDRLSQIRGDLRVAHDRLRSKLDRLVHDPKTAAMLQEPIVTQREGRFVVPLRAEFKGQLKAVIHDQSSSGATLFVEPLAVVDLNNQVRELELGERDEIRRILAELSTEVGAGADAVRRTVESLAEFDLALAAARYADEISAVPPDLRPIESAPRRLHPGSTVRLPMARHPLLDPGSAVPVDLVLDPETFALVITGPNTGGKTVALKTAGLLALMAQCGLHLPTGPEARISVFDGIYADIGDEQSIEQSLSTFSGHISAIIRILEQAGPGSLVLLDELGAGTDPEEGSALARAILGTLVDRRVTSLVATHYPELKSFAHATPGVRNASVEFDLASLRPTYHLSIGLPGRSNALAIASRLGLPAEVVERARRLVDPAELRAEGLLDEIHRQREEARQARREAEAARLQGEVLRSELKQRLEAIEIERAAILEGARQEAAQEAREVFEEAEGLRRRLARAGEPLTEAAAAAAAARALIEQTAEPAVPAPPVDSPPLRVGEPVFLRSLGSEGILTALGESEAEVQVGRLRVRAGLNDLSVGRPPEPPGEVARPRSGRLAAPVGASMEIDLRGLTVEEALEALDRQLDSAYLAGLPSVRVIHGKGTGRLRQAIREALRGNPYAAGFEPGKHAEGGEGVTLVRLADL